MPLTFAPMAINLNDGIIPTSARQILQILLPANNQLAHLWFLWVLFAFDCIAIVMHQLWNKKLELKWMNMTNPTIYAMLTIAVLITYQLMANIGGKSGWLTIAGPLSIPASKIGLDLIYFFLGVIMGSRALSEDAKIHNTFCITSSNKPSIPLGLSAILMSSCLVYIQINLHQVSGLVGIKITSILINSLYPISGMLLVISAILIAKKHLNQQANWLDGLNKDSYGIYIIHFLFVAWIQYLLIDITIPGLYKPIITAILSIALSWLISDVIRKFVNYLYFLKEIQPDN
jgi:peptidoglycan/LPS O-acetylase OafA/YrhL